MQRKGSTGFAVRARVTNESTTPAYLISVDAELSNTRGAVLARTTVYAGHDLSAADLEAMSIADALAVLAREIGDGGSNVRIEPGASLPVLVLFANAPEGELRFSLTPTSRPPGADSAP